MRPEALRLAEYLELPHIGQNKSAAELRRLHEVNEALRQAAEMVLEALVNFGQGNSEPEQKSAVYQCPRCATSMDVDINAKPVDTVNISAESVDGTEKHRHEHLFRIERRGSEWSIYRGRDHQHQGFLLGWLVETDYKTAKMLEDRLNAAPPKREWVGLTDEEVGGLTMFDGLTHIEVPILADFARAIEAKLKEKNT
jgi:hypothetical protein